MSGSGRTLSPEELLALVPQQAPFRFIDEIISVDDDGIEARYRWKEDADFYRGHFPGNPLTPGVLLLECMAQAGIVALGLYLLVKQGASADLENPVPVFTDASVEFSGLVRPGDSVRVTAKKVFYRRRKLRSEVEMHLEDGTLVCAGNVSGMGVSQ